MSLSKFLNKAKKILDWEPIFNFDQWLLSLKEKKYNFQDIIEENKKKRSIVNKFKKFFLKIKK